MARAVYYHIYIKTKEGITTDKVEEKMNLALDWFRYDKGLYVVYSTSDVKKWMTRLKPLAESGGKLFICELNEDNRNGWMNKDFWKWLREDR